jgi:hypothetical protein
MKMRSSAPITMYALALIADSMRSSVQRRRGARR